MPRGEVAKTFVRESLLAESAGGKVRCNVCERRCVLKPGGLGWCQTRENRDATLVTLIYGAVSSLAANPIEKKPFYHFHPGTRALTAGSWSCNFGCPWCQNWNISKAPPPSNGEYISPQRFLELVEETNCEGTSISFNEPTLSLEWSLDVFRLARQRSGEKALQGDRRGESLGCAETRAPPRRARRNHHPGNSHYERFRDDAARDCGTDSDRIGARGAMARYRLLPGVPVHRATHADSNAGTGVADRQGGRAGVCVCRQHRQPSLRTHVLSDVRHCADSPVRVRRD